MCRSGRNNAICVESLEKALAESPETYRHIDLIAFGFPCQDISNANPKGKGLKGERSSIYFECMRIVDILNPSWILIENVPRLLSINEGRDFAIVLWTLSESGYGYSWRVLDSQYFGVAQRRKRLFIVGCFGKECPPEILFEQKSSNGNDKKVKKMGQRGVCISHTISSRTGERNTIQSEPIIASTVGTTPFNNKPNDSAINIVTQTVRGQDSPQVGNKGAVKHNFVAQTIGATPRGDTSFVWQDTYIAETNSKRKGKTARFPGGLDSRRGIVIGNAVTVQVAQWIAERIMKYTKGNK